MIYTASVGKDKVIRNDIDCHYGEGMFNKSVMEAKIYKILSHQYYPNEPVTIWIDDNIKILEKEEVYDLLGDNDLVLFKHPWRNSLIEEAEYILQHPRFINNKWLMERISKQLDYYINKYSYNLLNNLGLFEANFIIRRNNETIYNLNNIWWSEICKWQYRDQISLPIAILDSNLKKIKIIDGNIRKNDFFEYEHKNYNILPRS